MAIFDFHVSRDFTTSLKKIIENSLWSLLTSIYPLYMRERYGNQNSVSY